MGPKRAWVGRGWGLGGEGREGGEQRKARSGGGLREFCGKKWCLRLDRREVRVILYPCHRKVRLRPTRRRPDADSLTIEQLGLRENVRHEHPHTWGPGLGPFVTIQTPDHRPRRWYG